MWLSPQTMVIPGKDSPVRTNDMNDALAVVLDGNVRDLKFFDVGFKRAQLQQAVRLSPQPTGEVGTLWSATARVAAG